MLGVNLRNEDAAVLPRESGFLKIRKNLCHSVDFFFQKNSIKTVREGGLPKEYQKYISCFTRGFPRGDDFSAAASLLPSVPR